MRRRWLPLLMATALALVANACGDDNGSVFEETTGPSEDTTSLFEGTPGTLPEPMQTIVIELGDEAWELPAAVCLHTDGDAAIVSAAAQQRAAEVRYLVGDLVSGWPTTTYSLSFDYPTYEEDLHAAGVAALGLARLVGEQAALEEAWVQWEQAFANPEGGWGGPEEISRRVDRWRAEAETLAGAIADYCATG